MEERMPGSGVAVALMPDVPRAVDLPACWKASDRRSDPEQR